MIALAVGLLGGASFFDNQVAPSLADMTLGLNFHLAF